MYFANSHEAGKAVTRQVSARPVGHPNAAKLQENRWRWDGCDIALDETPVLFRRDESSSDRVHTVAHCRKKDKRCLAYATPHPF